MDAATNPIATEGGCRISLPFFEGLAALLDPEALTPVCFPTGRAPSARETADPEASSDLRAQCRERRATARRIALSVESTRGGRARRVSRPTARSNPPRGHAQARPLSGDSRRADSALRKDWSRNGTFGGMRSAFLSQDLRLAFRLEANRGVAQGASGTLPRERESISSGSPPDFLGGPILWKTTSMVFESVGSRRCEELPNSAQLRNWIRPQRETFHG
ncbi:hypothetical protein MAMC_01704 [Methylacidimicrobium cyclopophantes]|uniref:Uncharacterized protein n=1 Tax=Methylacidimicrobium cyclopophantes TaxID=1041766 RepID=A0A5E6MEN6_9BACT|nr:hypothetical protein MAMC_01704 [Methylacidimicrobium cyclopophantes]